MCEFQRRLLRHNTFVIVKIRSSARNFGVRTRCADTLTGTLSYKLHFARPQCRRFFSLLTSK